MCPADGGKATVTERQKVVLERWKRRVEPQLIGVVAAVHGRQDTLDVITESLPQLFNSSEWTFDVAGMLEEEKVRVETASTSGPVEDLLRLLPGKGRLAAASQYVGMQIDDYLNLVNQSLLGVGGLEVLGESVRAGLAPHLPPRITPPAVV